MAMAAKAKLLMRELKTVKADLAFAKDRCAQLEEENRMLRESREKGDDADDDDLVSNLLLLNTTHFVECLCLFPKHPDGWRSSIRIWFMCKHVLYPFEVLGQFF